MTKGIEAVKPCTASCSRKHISFTANTHSRIQTIANTNALKFNGRKTELVNVATMIARRKTIEHDPATAINSDIVSDTLKTVEVEVEVQPKFHKRPVSALLYSSKTRYMNRTFRSKTIDFTDDSDSARASALARKAAAVRVKERAHRRLHSAKVIPPGVSSVN